MVIALIAIGLLIFLTNPDLLGKAWLYVVGFIGYLMVLAEKGFGALAGLFKQEDNKKTEKSESKSDSTVLDPTIIDVKNTKIAELEQKIIEMEQRLSAKNEDGNMLSTYTLTVLRYIDDGQTTLGMIFLRNKFFAYTLEDTHRDEKIHSETRIPAGIYALDFNRNDTPMTLRYRKTRPWFDYHLEIKNIPNYHSVYIHVGNTHEHTAGCILIADGVNGGLQKSLIQSRIAFDRFYQIISALLKSNEKVHIQILNEDWFERSKLTTL